MNRFTMEIITKYFGGVETLKQDLTYTARDFRERRNITEDDLDKKCGFGEYSSAKLKLPSIRSIESNPQIMTSRIFSKLSRILDISLSDALKPKILNSDLLQFVNRAEVMSSNGSSESAVDKRRSALLYLQMKAMHELKALQY